jgi:hypothetical protein
MVTAGGALGGEFLFFFGQMTGQIVGRIGGDSLRKGGSAQPQLKGFLWFLAKKAKISGRIPPQVLPNDTAKSPGNGVLDMP